jgi:hypothetical protein
MLGSGKHHSASLIDCGFHNRSGCVRGDLLFDDERGLGHPTRPDPADVSIFRKEKRTAPLVFQMTQPSPENRQTG